MPALPRILIALCTYNERQNVELLIPQLRAAVPEADLLFVDDNSPDGTGRYITEVAAVDSRVKLLHREQKEGLGLAIRAGFTYAVEQGYDLLVNMDADFSHPPLVVPQLIEAAAKADVVIASRYVTGGGVVGWPVRRRLMSWGMNTYVRLFMGLKTRDNSGSFRCYRVTLLKQVDLSKVTCRGYAVFEELLYRLQRVGASFVEIPYTFEERRFGTTKINLKEAFRALGNLAMLRLRGE